jgi:hypothetical protein
MRWHSIIYSAIGTSILAFGWMGFNLGSTLPVVGVGGVAELNRCNSVHQLLGLISLVTLLELLPLPSARDNARDKWHSRWLCRDLQPLLNGASVGSVCYSPDCRISVHQLVKTPAVRHEDR